MKRKFLSRFLLVLFCLAAVVTAPFAATTGSVLLKNIFILNSTISPSFSPTQFDYIVTPDEGYQSVGLGFEREDSTTSMFLNGTTANAVDLSLRDGETRTAKVLIRSADGTQSQTYNFTLKPRTNNADLIRVTTDVNNCYLGDFFDKDLTSYDVIPKTLNPARFDFEAVDPQATITVNSVPLSQYAYKGFATLSSANPTAVVEITARDGVTKKTYTFRYKKLNSNANLGGINVGQGTLSPAFDPNIMTYTITQQAGYEYSVVSFLKGDPQQTFKKDGVLQYSDKLTIKMATQFSDYLSTVKIEVTAPDYVTKKTYTVNYIYPFDKNLFPRMELESPTNEATVSDTLLIRGWYLDQFDIADVQVKVDGRFLGYAKDHLNRPDIKAKYPAYKKADCGFEYALNTLDLKDGRHQLEVYVNAVGTMWYMGRTIIFANHAPRGDLNGPTPNATISGTVPMRGWFVDGDGVAKIEVLIDGAVKGIATKGFARPDVLAAFPQYADGNSGYEYQLDTKTLINGSHKIVIRETSNKGVQTSLAARTVTVSNVVLPAKGDLNGPTANQIVSGTIPVWGWFLDGNDVSKIEVLVDGKVKGTATKGLARSDVLAAFPAYANSNSGYEYALDTRTLSNGNHTIVVRETSNKGIQTSLPARILKVNNAAALPAKGDMNSPTANQIVSGTIPVWGWFVDGNGVNKIEVLVDGKIAGTATSGLSRPDVLSAFPGYGDGNSGYEYRLDTTKLTNGNHTIVVRETSNKGVQTSLPARMVAASNAAVLLPKGDLNGPTANQTVSGTIPVWGWFVDGNGVNKIEVVVDGKIAGTATRGLSRPDVLSAYPGYGDGNSGYDYRLDTTKLTNGSHTIVVRETSNKGVQTSLPARTITASNAAILPPKGDLNGPTANQTVSGTIPVWGWFVDGNGVNKIEVLVDGAVYAIATKGLPRPDVLAAYPEYQQSNGGFDYWLDTTALSNGTHQIAVRETSQTGVKISLTASTVVVNNL